MRFSDTFFRRLPVGLSLQRRTSSKSRSPFSSRPLATSPTRITPRRVRVAWSLLSLSWQWRWRKTSWKSSSVITYTSCLWIYVTLACQPVLVSVCAVRLRLCASFFFLIQPVRHSLKGSLCVRYHILYIFQFLLSWVDDWVFGHNVSVIIHEDTHGTMTHWRRLDEKE